MQPPNKFVEELALLRPYVPIGIKQIKKKRISSLAVLTFSLEKLCVIILLVTNAIDERARRMIVALQFVRITIGAGTFACSSAGR